MANVASQIKYVFVKSTTTITMKGQESGDNFGFIPMTIDFDVAGVKKTEHDVYFPFKKGALIRESADIKAFGTNNSYTSLKRYEDNTTTVLI